MVVGRRLLGIRDWKRAAAHRKEWRLKLREASARVGLQCHGKRRRRDLIFSLLLCEVCNLEV